MRKLWLLQLIVLMDFSGANGMADVAPQDIAERVCEGKFVIKNEITFSLFSIFRAPMCLFIYEATADHLT